MAYRTEDLAQQGALVTPRTELQQLIPSSRRQKFGVVPRLFFDTTNASVLPAYPEGPAWDQQSRTGGRRYPMEVAARALVSQFDQDGGILTYGYGTTSTDGHTVRTSNFEEIFSHEDMQPRGDEARISEVLREAEQQFETRYGKEGPETRPIKLDIVISAGRPLDDMEDADTIRTAGQKHLIVVCVFGYDRSEEDQQFTNTLIQWGRVSQELVDKDEYNHKHLWVIPFDETADADRVSSDLQNAVS